MGGPTCFGPSRCRPREAGCSSSPVSRRRSSRISDEPGAPPAALTRALGDVEAAAATDADARWLSRRGRGSRRRRADRRAGAADDVGRRPSTRPFDLPEPHQRPRRRRAHPPARRARRARRGLRSERSMHRVLGILVDARLVTIDERTVVIAHEALIRHWPRLRGWIEADRTDS